MLQDDFEIESLVLGNPDIIPAQAVERLKRLSKIKDMSHTITLEELDTPPVNNKEIDMPQEEKFQNTEFLDKYIAELHQKGVEAKAKWDQQDYTSVKVQLGPKEYSSFTIKKESLQQVLYLLEMLS